MPTFYTEDLDITVDEFLSECSSKEISQLIKALKEDGHLTDTLSSLSIGESEHVHACQKISKSYHRLSNEDCDIIRKISSKL